MSQQSWTWLNENVITGFGYKPWHFREGISRDPFEGEVPQEEIEKLFPVISERSVGWLGSNGEWNVDSSYKRLVNEQDQALGLVGIGYQPHQYMATLGNMGLPAVSAGLLDNGARAWVQYGGPDEVTTNEGVGMSTKLLTMTSVDGSLSTQFRWVNTFVVCDNTLAVAAMEGEGTETKIRHTRFSADRVDEVRAEYGLNSERTEASIEAVDSLVRVDVTDAQIAQFLSREFLPQGEDPSPRAVSIGESKIEATMGWLNGAWSEYKHTALGVLNAKDSAQRWDFATRGKSAEERTWEATISGGADKSFTASRERLLELV